MCHLCKKKCHHKLEDKTFKNVKVCNDLTVKGQIKDVHRSRKLNKCDLKRRGENGTPDQRYELIIVGAGTAGCLLTYRLAERYPNLKVLVLETGQDDVRLDTATVPGGLPAVSNPNPYGGVPGFLYPGFPFVNQDPWGQLIRGIQGLFGEGCHCLMYENYANDTNQSYQTPTQTYQGRTIGGTSTHNAFIWNRGTKKGTYDIWERQTGDSAFGYTSMVETYKKIENRTSQAEFQGGFIPYWSNGPFAVTPGTTLNNLMGTTGRFPVIGSGGRPEFAGTLVKAINNVISTEILPGRTTTLAIDMADVNPVEPTGGEYSYIVPLSVYDQTDPNFLTPNNPIRNPYSPATTGSTYISPSGVSLGPDYAAAIGPPFPLPKSNIARAYSGNVYLYPIMDNKIPHNVTLKQRAYVTKLLFTNPKDPLECTGVEWVEGPNGEGWHVEEVIRAIDRNVAPYKGTIDQVDRSTCSLLAAKENQKNVTSYQAYAKGDIWLCTGSITTPALLQRSGIADAEFLNSVGVPVRFNLPGVGINVKESIVVPVNFFYEEDLNTGLGEATTPASWSSAIPPVYSTNYFANPSDPLNPVWDGTITGVPVGVGAQIRIKSDPTKEFHDVELATIEPAGVRADGGKLYRAIGETAINQPTTLDLMGNIRQQSNPASYGMLLPVPDTTYVHTNLMYMDYLTVASNGTVKILSDNPYQAPNVMTNLLGDVSDLQVVLNVFENSVLPILKGCASQRFGFRGQVTYYGDVAGTQVANNEIKLASALVENKPILGNIDQATYNTPGSLVNYTVLLVQGTGSGVGPDLGARVITAWSGAPNYVATVAVPYNTLPVGPADTKYILNPPNATMIDSVEFRDDNHRNFVRFANPSGDEFFSPVDKAFLADNPFTTSASSTRVSVDQPGHGFSTGDIVKIAGVAGPVDNIDASNFNDYHVVYVTGPDSYDIILFWNQTVKGLGPQPGPPGPPAYGPPDTNPAAAAVGVVGVGGSGITVETLRMDRIKMRKYIREHVNGSSHISVSCRMGKPEDETAVVDTRARIYNTLGLRACDASIFPSKPNGNIQAMVYAITQKIFDLVSVEEYDGLFL